MITTFYYPLASNSTNIIWFQFVKHCENQARIEGLIKAKGPYGDLKYDKENTRSVIETVSQELKTFHANLLEISPGIDCLLPFYWLVEFPQEKDYTMFLLKWS